MKTVYLLEHLHVISEDNECVKTIGVYENKQDALDAIKRLSLQPGFSDYPNLIEPLSGGEGSGFYMDEYEIGKDHWAEGFATV